MCKDDRLVFSGIREYRFFMVASGAHKLAEWNETVPSLCIVYGETENYWVGRWTTKYKEFWDVKFPKDKVKVPSYHDIEKYLDVINGDFVHSIKFKHAPDLERVISEKFMNDRLLVQK